jgi:hypothetical protein
MLETFENARAAVEADSPFLLDLLGLFDWLDMFLRFSQPEDVVGNNRRDHGQDGVLHMLRRKVATRSLEAATKTPGICLTSLWNLESTNDENYTGMLPILNCLDKISGQGPFPESLRSHERCNTELCVHAFEDTAKIGQLHKCDQKKCNTVDIPIEQLAALFENQGNWQCSAWDISQWTISGGRQSHGITSLLKDPTKKYMAVSHVWSDGTGVGRQKQGTVNSCLLNFWISIAKKKGCDGLWWDTICLPTEPGLRRNALSVMLENFRQAAVVVIHDQDLANSQWVSSGEPENVAIGLVLSNWFTRGWTAAEFCASASIDNVAVVVRSQNPQTSEPYEVIGLGNVILRGIIGNCMWSRPFVPTLAHLYASDTLNIFHEAGFFYGGGPMRPADNFESLMRMLRPRSTAWEKDRMVIASLLWNLSNGRRHRKWEAHGSSLVAIDYAHTIPELTQRLLYSIGDIPTSAIFHGKVPMSSHGGWSWSPPSLFDLGTSGFARSPAADFGVDSLSIDEQGVVRGILHVMTVTPQDSYSLYPLGSHRTISARIHKALETPEKCVILRATGSPLGVAPSILAMPVGSSPPEEDWKVMTLSCRYIGCVFSVCKEDAPLISISLGNDLDDTGSAKIAVNTGDFLEECKKSWEENNYTFQGDWSSN